MRITSNRPPYRSCRSTSAPWNVDGFLNVFDFTQRMKCELVARSVLISWPSCSRNCVPSVAFCPPACLLAERVRPLRLGLAAWRALGPPL